MNKNIKQPLLQPEKDQGIGKSKVQVSFQDPSEAKESKTKSSAPNSALKQKSSVDSMKDQ